MSALCHVQKYIEWVLSPRIERGGGSVMKGNKVRRIFNDVRIGFYDNRRRLATGRSLLKNSRQEDSRIFIGVSDTTSTQECLRSHTHARAVSVPTSPPLSLSKSFLFLFRFFPLCMDLFFFIISPSHSFNFFLPFKCTLYSLYHNNLSPSFYHYFLSWFFSSFSLTVFSH